MIEPRLMVVSTAGFQPINRAIYRELAKSGLCVHLVVPSRYYTQGRWLKTDRADADHQPYGFTLLEPKGVHPRLQTLSGLQEVAAKFGPTHVLVDSDPASMMTRQALGLRSNPRVWALTAENLPPRHREKLVSAVKERDIAAAASAIVSYALRVFVQPRVDRVFTLSKQGTLVLQGMKVPVTQIPLGFDPAFFYPQSEQDRQTTRTKLGLTRPTIAYFGRLVPEKGVHLLIDALKQIDDLEWDFLIDYFGADGSPYAKRIRGQIQRLGIADRVQFFEATHEEMPSIINAADVVVLPSLSTPNWREQYGRVIQEVMACGRTMVGSTSGAIPEVMGGYGHNFPEGDRDALAEVLRGILRSASFQDLSARAYALANLSIHCQAEIMLRELRGSM